MNYAGRFVGLRGETWALAPAMFGHSWRFHCFRLLRKLFFPGKPHMRIDQF